MIDYYDRSLEFHSPDPADPSVTIRVLTIMHVEDTGPAHPKGDDLF